MKNFYLLLLSIFIFAACDQDIDSAALEVYDGPIRVGTNIHLIRSDSAVVRSEIKAPKQMQFLNGNMEFPEGILIEHFEVDGTKGTILKADRGYFDKEKNLYRGEGNVQVDNILEDQHLQSEELFWDPNKQRIYTDKFVTIRDKETLFNGTGMEADQNFKNYTLKKLRDSRTILPGEDL